MCRSRHSSVGASTDRLVVMHPSLPRTMLAAIIPAPGGRPELRQCPVPEPGPGEVLVRVMASSVNPTDVMTWRRGLFVTGQTVPFVGGYDMSGIVVKLGRGVTALDVGDAVTGMPRFPAPAAAFAQYSAVPARHLARIPTGTEDLSAGAWGRWAGLPLAGLTAYQALVDTAHLQSGQTVLVHAASGGVGSLACQLAVNLGAQVTAVTSDRGRTLVEVLGTRHVVDRATVDWQRFAGCFDVVLDTVGGDTTPRSLAMASPDGVVVALHPYAHDDLAQRDPRLRRMLVEPDHHALELLIEQAARGRLTVQVGAGYPLSDLGDALLHVETNKTPGKTIIHIQGDNA